MSADPGTYKAFRTRLDNVLRQKDPAALRAFLVAEGQWKAEDVTDTEAAMWMMIATSPALRPLHDEAERWLLTHGHETEASAIFGGRRKASGAAHKPTGNPRNPGSTRTARNPRTPSLDSPARKPPNRPKSTPPRHS